MKPSSALSTLGWGIFCASSWTWCIGMFLPIIMLQRYGWAGFLVFALPNVLGCAAFGYVLRDRKRAQRMAESHVWGVRVFSIVTIAYHVFFIGFMVFYLLPLETMRIDLALGLPVGLLGVALLLSSLPRRAWPIFAGIVYVGSLAAFSQIGIAPLADVPGGERPGWELALLAPTIIFGFLLCPYLDGTFHRALRASPSRHAFAVFGVAFLVMIIMTCAYWDALQSGVGWIIAGHLTGQMIFTMAAHLREIRERSTMLPERWVLGMQLLPLVAIIVPLASFAFADAASASVDLYLRFLVFYGLVFPAYVLMRMVPRRRDEKLWAHGAQRPIRRLTRFDAIFALLLLASMPLYELGFIHYQTWLLPVALLAWLGWWAVARRS